MLVHVSAGYLPVRGWLHTCYSPVRRSPAKYCYSPLPLDLHVLSLSLAFILSQDQTLHCKILFRNFVLAGSCVHESRLSSFFDSRSLRCFVHVNILKNSSLSSSPSPFSRGESGCKDKTFFPSLPNLFQSFFKLFSRGVVTTNFYPLASSRQHLKNFANLSLHSPPPSGLAGAKITA